MELEGISKKEKEESGGGGGGGGGEIEKVNLSSAGASEIEYVSYGGEEHLPLIMGLVDQELSEPYSIFTYRYFVYLWPQLCFMAFHGGRCVGTVVCKMGEHRNTYRGYIAMLVVIKPYRGKGIATQLVTRSIQVMKESGCEEVTLEAEVTNKGALALYGRLGFIRAKRLFRYYLNGVDAFRLKLLFPRPLYSLPSQSQANNDNMAMPLPMED
ncbi:hypothetical protein ACFX13_023556 [Malus domestica]|uniref:N-acetyltransferase domain-containing protein n=1 Tax=Malus domestica TaxID=3750 RepID=A0A498HE08_MALDO|nr:N-alpha-acetyltransferase MAK3-like [Malus domestica]RXH69696.1 hypothetical protein DVH24_037480 [Malus domestica]